MFKIVEELTFTRDVTARVPANGGFIEETFKATFRAIDPEEAEAFDLVSAKGSTAFLKRVVVKLDELADATGQKIEFNDAVLASVLRLPWARSALAREYFAAVSGAKAGN